MNIAERVYRAIDRQLVKYGDKRLPTYLVIGRKEIAELGSDWLNSRRYLFDLESAWETPNGFYHGRGQLLIIAVPLPSFFQLGFETKDASHFNKLLPFWTTVPESEEAPESYDYLGVSRAIYLEKRNHRIERNTI
jgi:hypothetical protein